MATNVKGLAGFVACIITVLVLPTAAPMSSGGVLFETRETEPILRVGTIDEMKTRNPINASARDMWTSDATSTIVRGTSRRCARPATFVGTTARTRPGGNPAPLNAHHGSKWRSPSNRFRSMGGAAIISPAVQLIRISRPAYVTSRSQIVGGLPRTSSAMKGTRQWTLKNGSTYFAYHRVSFSATCTPASWRCVTTSSGLTSPRLRRCSGRRAPSAPPRASPPARAPPSNPRLRRARTRAPFHRGRAPPPSRAGTPRPPGTPL